MTLEIILPLSIDLLPFISPILSRVSYDHRDSVLGGKDVARRWKNKEESSL